MPISSPAPQRDCAPALMGVKATAAFAISVMMIAVLGMIPPPGASQTRLNALLSDRSALQRKRVGFVANVDE
jgi:hypothetical protein